RISQLPNDVLSMIVSRLFLKDGVRTMALSSTWRCIWPSTTIDLDDAELCLPLDGSGTGSVESKVSCILASHPGPFGSVRLSSCGMAGTNGETVRRWIRDIADKGVSDLVITNLSGNVISLPLDVLPVDLLRCTSLERLRALAGRHMERLVVDLPKLRELILHDAVVPEDNLDALLNGCPNLEMLIFLYSHSLPACVTVRNPRLKCLLLWLFKPCDLNLVDTKCLEHLIMWPGLSPFVPVVLPQTTIKISPESAENLRSVGYLIPGLQVLQIGETTINPGMTIRPSLMLTGVETLAIDVKFGVRSEEIMMLTLLFPNVKTLYIKSALKSPNPSDGELDSAFWKDNICSIECIFSKLRKIVLHEFEGEKDSEYSFIKSIVETSIKLEEMHEMRNRVMHRLAEAAWANDTVALDISRGNIHDWNYKTASDLSRDPFEFKS
ncbi:hypothetical protein BRADI_2g42613v3, partial [Brachypodium distachyon]